MPTKTPPPSSLDSSEESGYFLRFLCFFLVFCLFSGSNGSNTHSQPHVMNLLPSDDSGFVWYWRVIRRLLLFFKEFFLYKSFVLWFSSLLKNEACELHFRFLPTTYPVEKDQKHNEWLTFSDIRTVHCVTVWGFWSVSSIKCQKKVFPETQRDVFSWPLLSKTQRTRHVSSSKTQKKRQTLKQLLGFSRLFWFH